MGEMRCGPGGIIQGLLWIAGAVGCSNLGPCQYEDQWSVAAGAWLQEEGTNAYPGCSNEREPPGEMTLSIESVSHRRPCHSEHGDPHCLTSVTGFTDAWGEPCTAGFSVVEPSHVRFETGQTVLVNYRAFSGGSSGSGYGVSVWPVGVVRDDSGSIVVGAARVQGQGVVPTWFAGLELQPGQEVCEEGNALELGTPQGERCRVTPGEAKTCTLWSESYSVRGGHFGGGTDFILTRTDAMIPAD